MTCHSVNPNNPYENYKLPHISPRFRTKCYYLPVVLNKQRILHKNQLVTISRKKERERSSFLALGLLSKKHHALNPEAGIDSRFIFYQSRHFCYVIL